LGVIDRSTGPVVLGAVRVGGADWNVLTPRLPKLPPRRASAKSVETSVKATANVASMATMRVLPKLIITTVSPSCPLRFLIGKRARVSAVRHHARSNAHVRGARPAATK
jgi:hypothetical protein